LINGEILDIKTNYATKDGAATDVSNIFVKITENLNKITASE
jgi:hypothetical protein